MCACIHIHVHAQSIRHAYAAFSFEMSLVPNLNPISGSQFHTLKMSLFNNTCLKIEVHLNQHLQFKSCQKTISNANSFETLH